MKKITAVILSLVYLILSIGIIISFHYCNNQFSDIKVFGKFDESCCDSSCGFSHKCCSFETISGKITQEHVSSNHEFPVKEVISHLCLLEPKLEEQTIKIIPALIDTSPPPGDIPILNCSLTFYG